MPKPRNAKTSSSRSRGRGSAPRQPNPSALSLPSWLSVWASPAEKRPWDWRDAAVLLPILALGLVLRLVYLREIMALPDFDMHMMDAAYKDAWAKAILLGHWPVDSVHPDPGLSTSPYLRPPGYPFFLALVYLLTGTNYLAVRLIQMGLGLGSVALVYALGRSMFGRVAAGIAAGLMASYWALIYFEGKMNEASVVAFLLLVLVALARTWRDDPPPARYLWGGVVFGIVILMRTETILFAPFLAGWAWWATRGRMPIPRQVVRLTLFTAATAALILPVTARNYWVSGEFVPICTIGGLNLYAGNNPDADGSFPTLDYRRLFGVSTTLSHHNVQELLFAHRERMGDPTLGHADLERFFIAEALRFMRENPAETIRLAFRKTFLFWGPWEITSNKVLYFDRLHSPVLYWLPGFPLVAGLGWVGIALFFRRYRGGDPAITAPVAQAATLLTLLLVISFLTHLLFFVVGRFRVPILPILIIFSAYAVATILVMAYARDWRRAGGWGLAAIAAVAFFHIPLVSYDYELHRWHYQRGQAYGMQGDIDRAIEELERAYDAGGRDAWLLSEMGFARSVAGEFEKAVSFYERALDRDPADADTRNKLGVALLQLGEVAAAEEQFREAIRYDFTQPEARLNLARRLVGTQRFDEAREQYERLLEIHPGHSMARFEFGTLMAQLGEGPAARALFEAVVEQVPSHAAAWNYLGFERAAAGNLDGAREAYRRALQESPGFVLAHINLGNLHATEGRFDEATVHFAEVLELDEGNSLANQGLGFIHLERGEIEAAMDRFHLAVETDPGNALSHLFLGDILVGRGDTERGRYHLEQAVLYAPSLIEAQLSLGELLMRLGRPAEARARYEAALAIDPDSDQARAAIARIDGGLRGREIPEIAPGNVLLFSP